MPFKSSMSPVGCSTPKRASSQENSIVFPDIRTESPIAMAVSTPSPKPTPYRRSRTKSMDADFSLFPSLFKDKEAKLISRNNSRKNISAPKMKNLNRVISVLEEEFYPTDREIAQEHEITHLLKSESGGLLDTMETETKPSKRFWESTTFNPPSSPTYLPSRLNPESDCFYIEATPSPTSSCTSCSSLNPFNPGHRSPAGLRSKRKGMLTFFPSFHCIVLTS
ncbi:hypothetical protein K7432_011911 [Basidiobolus ranarum]|uniref:Uncharacterized protein n=1 Tax=Basidiobolus ranarum TaxID=34480 RepID=A0ABR2VT33_9FUNG